MTDKEYLALQRGDTIYALGYASPEEPEVEAYVFESRATGGRIFARKPSVLRAGEDAVFRLHASTTYTASHEAVAAHVAEKRNAVTYHERRLEDAKRSLETALDWAKGRDA
jgi:hypothetical protein